MSNNTEEEQNPFAKFIGSCFGGEQNTGSIDIDDTDLVDKKDDDTDSDGGYNDFLKLVNSGSNQEGEESKDEENSNNIKTAGSPLENIDDLLVGGKSSSKLQEANNSTVDVEMGSVSSAKDGGSVVGLVKTSSSIKAEKAMGDVETGEKAPSSRPPSRPSSRASSKNSREKVDVVATQKSSSNVSSTTKGTDAASTKILLDTITKEAEEPTIEKIEQKQQHASPTFYTQQSSIFAERDGHTLDFENIHLATKPTKKKPSKVILNGLTSSFEPKTLTAVMGPSGSGKTSLLKILTGRMGGSKKLTLNGTIRLDGKVVDPTNINIRKQIAYVEQDVSIPATATPREAITFSARLRLDKKLSDKEIDTVVNDILDNLGLTHVADTLIGGGPLMAGGLSGGEKKRVQCGVELVTNPEIVVLDEPTSGLDSYSAQSLMEILKKISNAGATVIVTIHQPPPPVVRKIDNLLLLLGGNIMYDGHMGMPVEVKFNERGFPKPDDYNIADWILQVAQTNSIKELEGVGFFSDEPKKIELTINETNRSSVSASASSTMEHVGFATQTRLLFDREIKKLLRDRLGFVIRVSSNTAFGLLFGFIFMNVGRSDYIVYPEVMASFGAQSNLLISTMFGVAQGSLMEFPKDRPVFLREYSTNHYSVVPYFLAKFSLECVTILMQVLIQLIAAFWLMGFKMNFFRFLALNFMLAIASTSIGIFIGSMVEDPSVAAELMPALIVPQLLFSGFFIQVELIPAFLRWAQYLCSLTYATRLATLFEFGDCNTRSCQSLLENNGVYEMEPEFYWIILLFIAALFRVTSMLILRGKASF